MSTVTVKPFKQNKRTFFGEREGLVSSNVLSAAVGKDGRVWIGTDKGVSVFENGAFVSVPCFAQSVQAMFADAQGNLWLACANTVCTSDGENRYELDSAVVDFAQDNSGRLFVATKSRVYALNGKPEMYFKSESEISDMALNENVIWLAAGGKLLSVDENGVSVTHETDALVQAVECDSLGMLWVGTDKGVKAFDSKSYWVSKERAGALCGYNTHIILFGKTGRRYVGTDIGVGIHDGAKRHFYVKGYWLPEARVTAIAESNDGSTIWVGTQNGVSRIETVMMTLREKADNFVALTEKYNVRDIGFVANRFIDNATDFGTGEVEISDNDGLWTGTYMLSQAFRYAVTGEEEALNIARRSMKAMLYLMKITGIPGFTARAIRRTGETGFGNGHPEWHLVTDETGEVEWKGETSSDEMSGHFVPAAVYCDFCATPEEKAEIREALCAIVDHIMTHNYRLCDIDGLPTTWGNWNPDDLNRNDRWFNERGVNSFELLSFLKILDHLGADKKYHDEYVRLVSKEHFAVNSMRRKLDDARTNHIDDHLGFLTTIPLLMYETDPDILQYYLIGLREHWEYERTERNPFWNILYGAYTGECCDLDVGINSLCELPMETMEIPLCNSVRNDLVWDYEGQERFGEDPQLRVPLPYDEKPFATYDHNQYLADRTWDDYRIVEGTFYLMPYWLGRYYGLIAE